MRSAGEREMEVGAGRKVMWKCGLSNTILDVLEKRPGWQATTWVVVKWQSRFEFRGENWDFYWVTREWMASSFDRHKFRSGQRICHFRNDFELTRKDFLVKNMKKMRKALEKQQSQMIADKCDFMPASYVLPVWKMIKEKMNKKVYEFRTSTISSSRSSDASRRRRCGS